MAYHERMAAAARAQGAREDVAQIAALAREAERNERQDQINQKRRDRERLAQLRETIDQATADVAESERHQQADERRQETALVDEQLAGYRARAEAVRLRKSFGLAISDGERKLLTMFGGAD